MSFQVVQKRGGLALRIGNKKNEAKQVIGYLLGMKGNVGKYKSQIFHFQQEKDGAPFSVWGSASMTQNLCVETRKGVFDIDPAFQDCLVRLTFQGMKKVKGRKEPMRDILVE